MMFARVIDIDMTIVWLGYARIEPFGLNEKNRNFVVLFSSFEWVCDANAS